ncbi:histidine kinase-like ATPase [Scheffersomyces coipomensis]|uniref:histidine kinase-like ATPase n=1 Tax=Scheffersomyces coipomensis TaxID=1788519 RepID=UPI00315C8F45
MSQEEEEIGHTRIRKLDDAVINKIAAGEIIIQPANALKEMLENSIDAHATMIEILVKEGGIKLLQITDNGRGINKLDLGLLCERFATSKISKFEDLESVATYGFRGEALASISHIARLSVVTKTADSQLAYKAFYLNGKLTGPNFKDSGVQAEPKPIAGKDGTQILVEDLFYNIPSRIKALRNKSDEFAKILDVIGRYAIHTGHVGFSCKRFGEPVYVLSTRPNLPVKERIRTVYGSVVANELLDIAIDGATSKTKEEVNVKESLGLVSVSGVITNANYNNKKKIQPIFFINHRLVSCDPLKRAVNAVFQFFLPKGNHPFMYLALEIDPKNLDVNIHPTKREVRFLNEDEIIELIVDKVHLILSNVDTSRKFKTQSILSKRTTEESSSQVQKKYRQENKLVRVDAQQSKISHYLNNSSDDDRKDRLQSFKVGQASQNVNNDRRKERVNIEVIEPVEEDEVEEDEQDDEDAEDEDEAEEEEDELAENNEEIDEDILEEPVNTPTQQSKRVKVNLKSIQDIKAEVNEWVHKPLTNVFNNAVYVGIVDETKRLCCFQYDVKLFLCDYAALLSEFYFQLALSEFCNYGEIVLSEPILLEDILKPLYEDDSDKVKSLTNMDEVITKIHGMKDMFKEYFKINIDEDNEGKPILSALPMIHKEILPPLTKLPYFFYRLGERVNYDTEKDCLQGIMRQIAFLYIPEPIMDGDNNKRSDLDKLLEHSLFPDIKKRFLATKNLVRDVVQIADLPGLYRVFERC